MEKKALHPIAHLYGEAQTPPADDVHPDLIALKTALDERPPQHPDADVLAHIFDAAAQASAQSAAAPPSKKPMAKILSLKRLPRWSVAAAITVMALGGGLWYTLAPTAPESVAPQFVEADARTELPAWEVDQDLYELSRRIQVLRTQDGTLGWGEEPAVPPTLTSAPPAGIQIVNEQR